MRFNADARPASLAISDRRSLDSFAARAFPPLAANCLRVNGITCNHTSKLRSVNAS